MNTAENKAGKSQPNHYNKTLTPAKAGLIYGKFTPSPVKAVMLKKSDGKTYPFPMTRKERRGLERNMTRIQRRKLRRRDK